MRLVVPFVVCAIASSPISAQSAVERAALFEQVAELNRAERSLEYRKIVLQMPPKVITAFAERAGVSREAFIDGMLKVVTGAAAKVTAVGVETRVQDVSFFNPAASPTFAIIPRTTLIRLDSEHESRMVDQDLAVLEDGTWFVMRFASTLELSVLLMAYPSIKGTAFENELTHLVKPLTEIPGTKP